MREVTFYSRQMDAGHSSNVWKRIWARKAEDKRGTVALARTWYKLAQRCRSKHASRDPAEIRLVSGSLNDFKNDRSSRTCAACDCMSE